MINLENAEICIMRVSVTHGIVVHSTSLCWYDSINIEWGMVGSWQKQSIMGSAQPKDSVC